jgi:hypothetical protein
MNTARHLNHVSGAILVAAATVLVLTNLTRGQITPGSEPVLGLRIDHAFWVAALLCGGGGWYCLLGERLVLQAGLAIWLALNFLIYAVGLRWLGQVQLPGVLEAGGLAATFGFFSPGAWEVMTIIGFFVVLTSSVLALLFSRHAVRKSAAILGPREAWLKIACEYCQGHIAFARERGGEALACPHCGKSIRLEPERSIT